MPALRTRDDGASSGGRGGRRRGWRGGGCRDRAWRRGRGGRGHRRRSRRGRRRGCRCGCAGSNTVRRRLRREWLRRCTSRQLGTTTEAELVVVLVFLAALRTGDHSEAPRSPATRRPQRAFARNCAIIHAPRRGSRTASDAVGPRRPGRKTGVFRGSAARALGARDPRAALCPPDPRGRGPLGRPPPGDSPCG